MFRIAFSLSEHRLLFRGETPQSAAESADSLDVFTNELRQLTAELRRTYAETTPGDDRRDDVRDALRVTENKLEDIRDNLFTDLRDSGLVPGLRNYISLGGDFPSTFAGLGWQPDSSRLWFDAATYPDYTGGDSDDGHGYSLDDPGTDSMFSALVGTPGSIDLVHLFSGHAQDPLPYTEREEPFYVAPTGLFPSPISMLSPQYGTDRSRVRSTTVGELDALRRTIPRVEGTLETRRRAPYGTPGRDGFPPAPPASELRNDDADPSGTPGSGGFPPTPPENVEPPAPAPARRETVRQPRIGIRNRQGATPAPERAPQADRVQKLETEMAETRREYDAARRDAAEARRLPPGTDRTARLTRLAERMENMVARIETLEKEIRNLRSSI